MALLLSMDIGSSSIKLVEGSHGKSGLNIERIATIPTPEGCIDNEYIINASIISDILQKSLREGKVKAKEVAITINAPNAVIREIVLPKGKPKEVEAMIKNEMVHTYHVDENDVVQYKHIGIQTDENGMVKDFYQAAALDERLIEGYHEILKLLKIKRSYLDINFNAMDKLFGLCNMVNGSSIATKACLFLDMGARYTTAYVRSEGEQKLSRHLNIGAGEIENILSDETLTSPDEMRTIKEGDFNIFSQSEQAVRYFEILKPYFYNLLEEIRKLIRFFYNRSEGDKGIENIYLFGGGSNLRGLTGYFEENLNIRTEQITSLSNISGSFQSKDLPPLLNAFGAIIRN